MLAFSRFCHTKLLKFGTQQSVTHCVEEIMAFWSFDTLCWRNFGALQCLTHRVEEIVHSAVFDTLRWRNNGIQRRLVQRQIRRIGLQLSIQYFRPLQLLKIGTINGTSDIYSGAGGSNLESNFQCLSLSRCSSLARFRCWRWHRAKMGLQLQFWSKWAPYVLATVLGPAGLATPARNRSATGLVWRGYYHWIWVQQ